MKKYEYKVTRLKEDTTNGSESLFQGYELQLNKLGSDGWELIQYDKGMFLFKRELA